MKPIKFKEANVTFAKDQAEYLPLPAFKPQNSESGEIVCCWGLTLRERLKIIFTGKVWVHLLTFHNPLQPIMLSVDKHWGLDENGT